MVLWEHIGKGTFTSPPAKGLRNAAVSSPSGPSDPAVDSADIKKFLSVSFVGVRAIDYPTTKFLWGSGPLDAHGIGANAVLFYFRAHHCCIIGGRSLLLADFVSQTPPLGGSAP